MINKTVKSLLRGVVIIGFIIGIQTVSVQAQKVNPERLAAAKEVLKAMNMDKLMARIIPGMMQQLKQAEYIKGQAARKDIDEAFSTIETIFIKRTSDLTGKVAVLYAETFTVAELKDLGTFYKSPTGQKILQKMPGLMQKSMVMGRQWGMSLMPEIMKKKEELMKAKAAE